MERTGPRHTQRFWAPRVLLEDLQGMEVSLMATISASVVQVDVMLLRTPAADRVGGALRTGAGEGLGAFRVGGHSPRDRAAHMLAGGCSRVQLLMQGWSEGSWCS